YNKAVYGLNPKYSTVQGVPCFSSVDELPQPIDAAVFCVSADNVKKMLPQLQQKGLKAAVIYSAGFGESGPEGKENQQWLREFALSHNIALLGPNCVGQVSFAHKRALTF